MKKFNYLLLCMLGLFIVGHISAQEILVVDPGEGTLNAAIDEHGGNKIYQLQAGEWYGLTKTIENVDYHLQVIGEPYDDQNPPATLQTGTTAEGDPIGIMFEAKGDITLRGIYFVNADLNGQLGARFVNQSKEGGSVVVDNCIIDPVGHQGCVWLRGGDNDLFFTNNISLRHGHMTGINDGHHFLIADAAAPSGADTVIIENNTIVSVGTFFIMGAWNVHVNNFVKIDHNTIMHHKGEFESTVFENEFYLTNNLLIDFSVFPTYDGVVLPGGDVDRPKRQLIMADTIVDETLPSNRIQYIQYNSLFRSQSFYELLAELNDTATVTGGEKPFFQTLVWDGNTPEKYGADPADALDASREGILFNHAGNVNNDFPMWKYGNISFDVDPVFNEPAIYEMSDNLAGWLRPIWYIYALGYPSDEFPPTPEWPQWHWDPSGDAAINDIWPVIDATYTDAATLEGSVASLPLGDLNWYPEKMAEWEMNKEAIFAHMKAGNTEKISFVGVNKIANNGSTLSKIYPNPMSTSALIEFTIDNPSNVEIAVYNAVGQQVRNVMDEFRTAGRHTVTFERGNLNHGVYFYTIKAGNQSETRKLMIVD